MINWPAVSQSQCITFLSRILIGHVRYINILTRLRGFQDKLLYLVVFSSYPILVWELTDKKKINKFAIFTRKSRSHVGILRYRTCLLLKRFFCSVYFTPPPPCWLLTKQFRTVVTTSVCQLLTLRGRQGEEKTRSLSSYYDHKFWFWVTLWNEIKLGKNKTEP